MFKSFNNFKYSFTIKFCKVMNKLSSVHRLLSRARIETQVEARIIALEEQE